MLALRTHWISRRSQRQHLSRRPQSLIPAALSVHVPRQFAALSSHFHFCAFAGEVRSAPVPMSAIARKRCRVMIGPPEKGASRSDPNLLTRLNPAGPGPGEPLTHAGHLPVALGARPSQAFYAFVTTSAALKLELMPYIK